MSGSAHHQCENVDGGPPGGAGAEGPRASTTNVKTSTAGPFLARQLSKWFCDTSTGTAIRAARCVSFVGWGFGLLVASYG
jgi:hypothetical protein